MNPSGPWFSGNAIGGRPPEFRSVHLTKALRSGLKISASSTVESIRPLVHAVAIRGEPGALAPLKLAAVFEPIRARKTNIKYLYGGTNQKLADRGLRHGGHPISKLDGPPFGDGGRLRRLSGDRQPTVSISKNRAAPMQRATQLAAPCLACDASACTGQSTAAQSRTVKDGSGGRLRP
jgi:hypothetical protein